MTHATIGRISRENIDRIKRAISDEHDALIRSDLQKELAMAEANLRILSRII